MVYHKFLLMLEVIKWLSEKVNPRINVSIFRHRCLCLLLSYFWRDIQLPQTLLFLKASGKHENYLMYARKAQAVMSRFCWTVIPSFLSEFVRCQFRYTRYVLNTFVTFTWHHQVFVHFYLNVCVRVWSYLPLYDCYLLYTSTHTTCVLNVCLEVVHR